MGVLQSPPTSPSTVPSVAGHPYNLGARYWWYLIFAKDRQRLTMDYREFISEQFDVVVAGGVD